jgi:hypothetical protein
MFEVGKVYLLEHNHKAFGGGTWSSACKALTDTHIQLGNRFHELSTVEDNYNVLACLGDYNFHATEQPVQPQSIVDQNNHGAEDYEDYDDE